MNARNRKIILFIGRAGFVLGVAAASSIYSQSILKSERLKHVTAEDTEIANLAIEAFRTEDLAPLKDILDEPLDFTAVSNSRDSIRPYFEHGKIIVEKDVDVGIRTHANVDPLQTDRTCILYRTLKFEDGFEALALITSHTRGHGAARLAGFRIFDARTGI